MGEFTFKWSEGDQGKIVPAAAPSSNAYTDGPRYERFQVRRSIEKDAIVERMRANMLEFPELERFRCRDRVSICGYGPSLADTIGEINRARPIVTTSGAHDLLIAAGIIPTYHVECDPREHKLAFLRAPHPDVTYFIGSTCHPEMFRALRGHKVVMWHPLTDAAEGQIAMARQVEPNAHFVGGGSNAGLRSLVLMFHEGYRTFDCHGLDFSYRGEQVWAGPHNGEKHRMFLAECNGREFHTSDVMVNACQDFFELMHSPKLSGCHFRLHGDGLLAERVLLSSKDMSAAAGSGWLKYVAPITQRAVA